MKVLQFICSTGFYGAERWVLALCKNTAKDDCEYVLGVTEETDNQDLELVKHFARDCGETVSFSMSNKFDYAVVGQMVNYIKQNNIDIIHTHGYKSDIIGTIVAKKANIPVVITPHGFENASDFKLRTFIWLGCQAMRFADKVVPLSPALVEDVKKFGIKPPALEYIQNGVDLSEVEHARDNLPANHKQKFRIGFIGQMISRKNIKHLLDVFANMHNQFNDIELVLLGDGEERPELERYVDNFSCKSDIHFLGYRDDRLAYLKSFDIFAMTSTLEGIPRCLMEACAMGVPVVSYDIDGVDQLITHEQTGLLAPLNNKEALEQLFVRVKTQPEEAKQLGANAIAYVNEHYSAARMANEYLVLFNDMLKETHKERV
ncbi:MAG: glycosyltransferase family 4 protein [Glaciecola sp.]